MVSPLEVFRPSYLLFPALLGSAILALVCPLVGAHLILRRRIFLGLTLPQLAACGVAFTFWLYHEMGLAHGAGGERLLAMVGSLLFTLIGMAFLAYFDRHATGSPEGRLAAAYALASALTILFVVFNPAGELEILNLLKGEVIALSHNELKLLAAVYGVVLVGLVLFRREFVLTSFDPDLAALLTGGKVQWSVLLYLLCGLSIAVGVIMAGPLLVFGFMVLPPLSARPFARGTASFFALSSLIGVFNAICGFYLSIVLDLPLGPTDVALGCLLLFVSHALNRAHAGRTATIAALCLASACVNVSCSSSQPVPVPLSSVQGLSESTVWIAKVKNSTNSDLRLPSGNPLRSLGEITGKLSPESRPTVMDLLRASLQSELERRKIKVASPEAYDARFGVFSPDPVEAARTARAGNLSGLLLITNVQRWNADGRQLLSARVDFKLLRLDDSSVIWEKTARRVISTTGAAHLGQASADAVQQIMREIFDQPLGSKVSGLGSRVSGLFNSRP
jgi:ABC-type Mn2+/Zn2+ transport system permease subunit